MSLRERIAGARASGAPGEASRARAGLIALVEAMQAKGEPSARITDALATGKAAEGIGRMALDALSVGGLACAEGCAFCCILSGEDGGTIGESEARNLHAALAPLAGQRDGRDWHPQACAALDPDTRRCRAYDARPMICRSYVSDNVAACESVATGVAAPGPGTLGPYHAYLAALGLSRAALKGVRRVSTYSLSRLTRAAVSGQSVEEALDTARHGPSELEAELRRSKRDIGKVRPAHLP
jgi:hypothetical protein